MEPRPVQRLADIDVAEAGDAPLVEQGCLERRAPAGEQRPQPPARQLRPERLDAEAGEAGMLFERAPFDQVHEAEAPRVAVDQVLPVIGFEDQVVVALRLGRGAFAQHHPPGHAEMGEPRRTVVELREDILRAPSETFDTPALQARREALRQGKAQLCPALLNAPEPPARKRPGQPPHHRLDFRQFRHGGEANAFRRREERQGSAAYRRRRGWIIFPGMSGQANDSVDFGFRDVPRDDKARLVRGVFDSVAPRYDLMNDLMSLGVHRLWKAALVRALRPRPGMALLDVAGGTGDIAVAAVAEGAQAVVVDINEDMAAAGRDRALDRGRLDVGWAVADAEALPFADMSQDAVTIAFGLRNVTGRGKALSEMRRVLKPGGRFFCMEFSHVEAPALRNLYERYAFGVLPRLGALVAGDADAYRYLAESIARFPDREALAASMRAAGFGRVRWSILSGGIVALHRGWRL